MFLFIYIFCIFFHSLRFSSPYSTFIIIAYIYLFSRSLPFFIIGFNHNFCYCCCCCFDCTCSWRERNDFAYNESHHNQWINHINSLRWRCFLHKSSFVFYFLPQQISGFLCSHVCDQSSCFKDSVAGAQSLCTRFRCLFFFCFITL